jgi:hypothetical protein
MSKKKKVVRKKKVSIEEKEMRAHQLKHTKAQSFAMNLLEEIRLKKDRELQSILIREVFILMSLEIIGESGFSGLAGMTSYAMHIDEESF